MTSKPVIDRLNRRVDIDGFMVLTVIGGNGKFRWNSSIWMRSGRTFFRTPDEALDAGIKALRLN